MYIDTFIIIFFLLGDIKTVEPIFNILFYASYTLYYYESINI